MAFHITISHFYVYDKEIYQGDILSWLNGVGSTSEYIFGFGANLKIGLK